MSAMSMKCAVELDLIAKEMLTFPSKSSKSKNCSDLMTAIP